MAKGKHAAALFEVIHSDRRFGKKVPAADRMSTPKWWFKGKTKDRATTSSMAAPAASVAPVASAPVQAAPSPIDYMPSIPNDTPRPAPMDVKVDQDRQEIAFKLTYTTAAVGAFALAVVLGLAYLVGKRMSAGPQGVMAATSSTNQIRKGAPQPGVLDLTKAASEAKGAPASIFPDGHDESANVIDPVPTNANPKTTIATPTAAAAKPFDGKRIINKNYVVMQSFPDSEKELAEQAVKRLHEAGIGASIEQGLKGWPKTWYSVVGTMPFEYTKGNPVYDAYYKSIMDVSTKYAGKSQFKKFDPMIKKWQEN